jgi:hypothetical protein
MLFDSIENTLPLIVVVCRRDSVYVIRFFVTFLFFFVFFGSIENTMQLSIDKVA